MNLERRFPITHLMRFSILIESRLVYITKTNLFLLNFGQLGAHLAFQQWKKLENFQNIYKNDIQIITVSTDNKKNLLNYISSTETSLRVAFDTSHHQLFYYKYIPHTVLIDKNGIVKAITTPDKITKQVINDLIEGKQIHIKEDEEVAITNSHLNMEFKNHDYQYRISAENKDFGFKNKIQRDDEQKAISLDFRNVSIYRLMTDIYELSSAARIYSEEEISPSNKYCFQLEQNPDYNKDLLQNAKEILNSNLDVKAEIIEKEMDSVYVLEIIDSSKLPAKSSAQEKYYEYRGPYYQGRKVSSYNLIEYLENEVQQPVKDKVLLSYPFDIELEWTYGDGKTLNRELEKYGFRISRSEKVETVRLLELTGQ